MCISRNVRIGYRFDPQTERSQTTITYYLLRGLINTRSL